MIRTFLVALTIFFAYDARNLFAQPVSESIKSRVEQYVDAFASKDEFSGTLLVAKGDEILCHRSWGLSNREDEVKFNKSTTSCIASLSKPITVIIAAKLINEGRLSLSDPVSKWIKDFPSGDLMTVQHLLNHRAGIPHRLSQDETVPRTAADMVALAKESELDFVPGTSNQYSSGGYSVLARILELASGKTYEQLVEEVVLKPLDLKNTFHPGPGIELANSAKSYVAIPGGRKSAPSKHYSFLVGAGSLFSTPGDIFRISRALVAGKFGEPAKAGLVRQDGLKWNGITNFYRAFLDFDSETEITVALVSNQMTGANDLIRKNVPKIVLGERVPVPDIAQPNPVELPEDLLNRYAGTYHIGGRAMAVTTSNSVLFAGRWLLIPVSKTEFYSPQDYQTVTVILQNGSPTSLDWGGMSCPRLGPLKED